MRITKKFRDDQELILRFLDVLGGGATILSSSKQAGPDFFITAYSFIIGYIDASFFKEQELLITALEDSGFPINEGPIAALRTDQSKSNDSAEHILNASKGWQEGDEDARSEIGWATSDYTSIMRQHLERLKTRIIPLLEQSMTLEDEHRILDGLNMIAFENSLKKEDDDKYIRLVKSLEDELSSWK